MLKARRILRGAFAIVGLYCLASGVLWLGLQVSPAWGSVSALAAIGLVGAWIYAAVRRRRR